jgi:hypothetical protein
MSTKRTDWKRFSWAYLLVAALLAAGICVSARADQSADNPGNNRADDRANEDPPGRVARINFLQGAVSFQSAGGGDNDWVDAIPNRPITTGDRLWADNDGRAELHVGSTAIRLDRQTGISFLNLSDNIVQVQLSAGTMIVRLRRLDANDTFEIDSPNLAFSVVRPGDYRVDVNPDSNLTVVSVLQGEGEVTGGGRSYKIISDQRATFTGSDSLSYDLADAHVTPPSEFDRWAADRDVREDHLASARYVSPEMTGSEDLDKYGDWRTSPDYGPMWVPARVAVDWAPYRYGRWVWVRPYGWTWVEDEPWGFAPFHYGRWVFVGATWGWVPGPVVVRPVYAPALVAWVGGGPGFNFSVAIGGGGGVAWFPLGPREVYVPPYRVSEAYVTRVNVTNTVVERTTVINVYHNTNVTNVRYVNQHVGGGVTVVSHDTFVNARPVASHVANVPQRDLAAAPVSRGIQVQPEHTSIVGADHAARVRPPAAVVNRTSIVRAAPPAPAARIDRQGFDRRGNEPANTPAGRTFNGAPNASNAPNGPNREPARTVQPTPPQPSQPAPAPAYRPQNGPGQPDQQGQRGQQGGNDQGRGNVNGNAPARTVQPTPPQPAQPTPAAPAPAYRQPNRLEQQGQQGGNDQGRGNVNGNAPARTVQPTPPQPAQPTPAAPAPAYRQPNRLEQQGGNGQGGNANVNSNPRVNSNPPEDTRPSVRPAPPVRAATPAEQQNDARKEQGWQQQHEQVHRDDAKPARPDSKSDSSKKDRSNH